MGVKPWESSCDYQIMTAHSPSKASQARARTRMRHRFYQQLFAVMALQMLILGLPPHFHSFSTLCTAGMLLILLTQLGRTQLLEHRFSVLHTWSYRGLGVVGLAALMGWLFNPVETRWSGVVLLFVLGVFMFWSLLRLLVLLRQEETITTPVLVGAVSGYLMLGITGGLLLSVLETMRPGSFVDLVNPYSSDLLNTHGLSQSINPKAWDLDFSRINYFAFVSITTVGYGDIVPVHRIAQMASVSLSIMGPLYLAVVMGLLISRYTVQTQQEEDERDEEYRNEHHP